LKIALLTLGCKVNQSESGMLERGFRSRGFSIVGIEEKPDYCVINTCTVTSRSDYQSRQLIRRAAAAGARVIVTGCYSEMNMDAVRKMPGVVQGVFNSEKENIINNIEVEASGKGPGPAPLPGYLLTGDRSRFFLKIEDGCNRSCSYCIIPKARGGVKSLEPSRVLARVREATEAGFREVILNGIHIGLYGTELNPKMRLSELIKELLEKTDIKRIRVSSIEINEIDDLFIDLLSDTRVCRHLHVPLQSGDDRILGLMNRPYNIKYFRDKILDISDKIDDLGLGTDIIAGFPGESAAEFAASYEFIKGIPFTYLHVFPYSMRPGTGAAGMIGKVLESEKKARCQKLRELGEDLRRGFVHKVIGKVLAVVIEERTAGMDFTGLSDNYIKVFLEGSQEGISPRDIANVRILGQTRGGAFGELVFKT
jgi:threonylcarbamoyladenosine tRNA methylthiotransferase MtaB